MVSNGVVSPWRCASRNRNRLTRRVRFGARGELGCVYVDNKEEVIEARDAFRAKQRQAYKEARDGGFN